MCLLHMTADWDSVRPRGTNRGTVNCIGLGW